jgi:hypothetical protein
VLCRWTLHVDILQLVDPQKGVSRKLSKRCMYPHLFDMLRVPLLSHHGLPSLPRNPREQLGTMFPYKAERASGESLVRQTVMYRIDEFLPYLLVRRGILFHLCSTNGFQLHCPSSRHLCRTSAKPVRVSKPISKSISNFGALGSLELVSRL